MFRRVLHRSVCLLASSSARNARSAKDENLSSPDLLKGRENELARLSPRCIADILDNYIVGQSDGKRAVAIALRNRWRRKQLPDESLRKEVMPKNILLIGPTGVGKTEISRRMARITDAPFIKVEATKYTEVGFKGKDVEGIIEDLYTNAKIKAKRALSTQREAEAESMAIDIVYSNWITRRHMHKLDEALRNAVPGVKYDSEDEETTKCDNAASSPASSSSKKSGKKGRKSKKAELDDPSASVSSVEEPASSSSSSASPSSQAESSTFSSEAEVKEETFTSSQDEQGKDSSVFSGTDESTLDYFRQHYMTKFKDDLVTIELSAPSSNNANPSFKLPSSFQSSSASDIQWIGTLVGGLDGSGETRRQKTRVTKKVIDAIPLAKQEALEKLIDDTQIKALARILAEEEGVVFIDEIDKVVTEANSPNSDVSSTGVQQDLLPLVEGSSVTLKDGTVIQTDNVLFICSGAFHMVKTSDMLAELQGRLPVRVELTALSEKDFYKILTEPKFNLLEQQQALMKTEGIDLVFTEDGTKELARVTCVSNTQGQNIGARRLHTVLERVMDAYSFNCDEYAGGKVEITASVVKEKTEKMLKNADLAKYLL